MTDIALVGYGTVGQAVADRLLNCGTFLAQRMGVPLRLRYIVDRDPTTIDLAEKHRSQVRCSSDIGPCLKDPQVGIVAELIGDVEDAYRHCCQAIDAGKHVVTANKALMAERCGELLSRARRNNVTVAYEASCGAGIPIIRALYDGLVASNIRAVYGIVNGTCNSILSTMSHGSKMDYETALREAQNQGLAEKDPSLDVQGTDSAHKIALLCQLAFGANVDWRSIPAEGISTLRSIDIKISQEMGYRIKLLAMAERQRSETGGPPQLTGDPTAMTVWVAPCLIAQNNQLAMVEDCYNAIAVYDDSTGTTLFYGRGAGGAATASAVLADIASIASGAFSCLFSSFGRWPDKIAHSQPVTICEAPQRFYIRSMIARTPKGREGAIAQRVRAILQEQGIVVGTTPTEQTASIINNIDSDANSQPLITMVEPCTKTLLTEALRHIDQLNEICEQSLMLPVLHKYPETSQCS